MKYWHLLLLGCVLAIAACGAPPPAPPVTPPAPAAETATPADACCPTDTATVCYTCPHCPGVKSDTPGVCPHCNMALQKCEPGSKPAGETCPVGAGAAACPHAGAAKPATSAAGSSPASTAAACSCPQNCQCAHCKTGGGSCGCGH